MDKSQPTRQQKIVDLEPIRTTLAAARNFVGAMVHVVNRLPEGNERELIKQYADSAEARITEAQEQISALLKRTA